MCFVLQTLYFCIKRRIFRKVWKTVDCKRTIQRWQKHIPVSAMCKQNFGQRLKNVWWRGRGFDILITLKHNQFICILPAIYIDLDKPEIHLITLSKAHTGYLFHLILTGSPDSPEGINQEQNNHIRLLNYHLKTILKLNMDILHIINLPVIFYTSHCARGLTFCHSDNKIVKKSNFSNQKSRTLLWGSISFLGV